MARKSEPGIDYYPKNVNQIRHEKIQLLMGEFGHKGYWIYECLLSRIYEVKGYYMDLKEEDKLMLFANNVCKSEVSLVNEVIRGCVRRDLFDKGVFDTFNVLTSDRIQENYIEAKKESARKGTIFLMISEYMLIGLPSDKPNFRFCWLNSNSSGNNQLNSGNYSHSSAHRIEEIKIEEMREGFSPPQFEDVFVFFKKKAGWDLNKGTEEADAFLNYYGRTGWKTNNGPITNWENAASGWIKRDRKAGEPAKQTLKIPELPDDIFYKKLSPEQKQLAKDKWCADGHRYQQDGETSRMGWYLKDGTKVTPRV